MIIDVRSPSEYAQGHIPGAHNIPLLGDQERVEVGTCYKQHGQASAILLGFKLVGPKAASLLTQFKAVFKGAPLKIYCWRGGLRSQSIAQLLQLSQIPVEVLPGGYKAYRQTGGALLSQKWQLQVLGGMTGVGKTEILQALENAGEQVLDLEALANHRGSAFGTLGMGTQPTTEHFHNLITEKLSHYTPTRPLWIEDESRLIGTCHLPEVLYVRMQSSPLFLIERPLEERLEILGNTYGDHPTEDFIHSLHKIERKLGGALIQHLSGLLSEGKRKEAATQVLGYYDKSYHYHLAKRAGPILPLHHAGLSVKAWGQLLQESKFQTADLDS